MPLDTASNAPAVSGCREIAYVEQDALVKAMRVSKDPYFNQQWGLTKIQAPQAWNITHGSPTIKIAILDSGIDSAHPDLASKIVAKKNFSDSPTTEDLYSHGTHVAGIAAAITDNATGVAGMGYNSSLMNVKVLNDDGGGSYSWIIEGIIWAADNKADVINLSISGDVDSPAMKEAVDYAWNKGAVVVAAAGNNGSIKPSYPACYDNAIAVTAVNSDDQLCSFSDYGDWIDVVAPGDAVSTLPNNSYGSMGGTSMAAPFVSGLAGLAFAVAGDTDGDGKRNDEIRQAIQNGCNNIGISGSGNGRINAYKTLSLLMAPGRLIHPEP